MDKREHHNELGDDSLESSHVNEQLGHEEAINDDVTDESRNELRRSTSTVRFVDAVEFARLLNQRNREFVDAVEFVYGDQIRDTRDIGSSSRGTRPVLHSSSSGPLMHSPSNRPVLHSSISRPVMHSTSNQPVTHSVSSNRHVLNSVSRRHVLHSASIQQVLHSVSIRPVLHSASSQPLLHSASSESSRPMLPLISSESYAYGNQLLNEQYINSVFGQGAPVAPPMVEMRPPMAQMVPPPIVEMRPPMAQMVPPPIVEMRPPMAQMVPPSMAQMVAPQMVEMRPQMVQMPPTVEMRPPMVEMDSQRGFVYDILCEAANALVQSVGEASYSDEASSRERGQRSDEQDSTSTDAKKPKR
ncbi:hypothetical protein QVD17_38556 [Tagetes erecta]|uniref:Uncharacterized protein n=1 Tax=Tagetes erecta TaxID=13708 RepID=A0AAD8JQP9_TARER|nr:hypothetical protein QVD17_38556 [Tagetes erecta]